MQAEEERMGRHTQHIYHVSLIAKTNKIIKLDLHWYPQRNKGPIGFVDGIVFAERPPKLLEDIGGGDNLVKAFIKAYDLEVINRFERNQVNDDKNLFDISE
jgi:hypothetical protein